MVEMLGVLAIMGVLSVGGITAYRLTLDKYRTNKLEDDSYLRAFTIANQIRNRRAISLAVYTKQNKQPYGTFSSEVVDLWINKI